MRILDISLRGGCWTTRASSRRAAATCWTSGTRCGERSPGYWRSLTGRVVTSHWSRYLQILKLLVLTTKVYAITSYILTSVIFVFMAYSDYNIFHTQKGQRPKQHFTCIEVFYYDIDLGTSLVRFYQSEDRIWRALDQ